MTESRTPSRAEGKGEGKGRGGEKGQTISWDPPSVELWRGHTKRFLRGAPLLLRPPWTGVAANGVDSAYLAKVYRRGVVGAPIVEKGSDFFRVRHRSSIEGSAVSDRLSRFLSGGEVEDVITAFGASVLVVESRLGGRGAVLILGLNPRGDSAEVSPIFGVPWRLPLLDGLSARLSWWLFQRYLAREVEVLEGLRFHPRFLRQEDDVLASFLEYPGGVPLLDREDS